MSFWRAPNSILDVPSLVFEEFGQNYCKTSKRDAQGGWAAKSLQNLSFSGILRAQQSFNLNRMERIELNAKGQQP